MTWFFALIRDRPRCLRTFTFFMTSKGIEVGSFYPCAAYDGPVRDLLQSLIAERIGVVEKLRTGPSESVGDTRPFICGRRRRTLRVVIAAPMYSSRGCPSGHWMTCSAFSNTDCGIVSPSAFAVLRLMTSSNLMGCSMGRSAGFAPFRTLST